MGNPRRANGHRRDQVRRWVLATQDTCGICGRPVDKSLGMSVGPDGRRRWDPMAPEVDEIVPVSKGGSPFARDNVQLVHRVCNQRKGDGSKPSAATARLPLPSSRDW